MSSLTRSLLPFLAACASEQAQYDADCGDGWFDGEVAVDVSGAAPAFSWPAPTGDALELDVRDQSADPPPSVWFVRGDFSAPVTYGELPTGATEDAAAIPLVRGTAYSVALSFPGDEFNCGISGTFTAP
jgi:hypothetical protein